MGFKDQREWIEKLEKEGELKRVKAEVDWDEELGAVTREVQSRGARGPALLFENIRNHKDTLCKRFFTNGTGSKERVALALGLPKETGYREITQAFKERFATPVTPEKVSRGSVKENILMGDRVDLTQFPVPKWNPLDGGRYLMTSSSTITADPDTGVINAGTYRGMVHDKNTIATLVATSQGWGKHYTKYKAKGQEMPVAIVYGWDPSLYIVASTPVEYPEYEITGGLRKQPVPLVKCETNDLWVPADAEIVMEGRISSDPRTFEMEGPFGEYTGYYGGEAGRRHTIKIDCITHRNNPILMGCTTGSSPGRRCEPDYWAPATFAVVAWNVLEMAGVPNILGVWNVPVTECTNTRVQIRKIYRGHAKQVANAIWGSGISNYLGKLVIVVDEDIDIYDDEAMEWALAYRVNAAMGDISFFPGTIGSMLDPSIPLKERNIVKYGQGIWTRVLIDATINWELEPQEQYGGNRYPTLGTEISPRMKELLARRWGEYGI